jgi:DNA-binding NtrC family response regulator
MKSKITTRTLVIDDDPAICRTLQDWLVSAEHEVTTFSDPAAGLQFGLQSPCHIALVDLRMPNLPGNQLISTLSREAPDTRVVAMTAFPDTSEVTEAFRNGARDLIEKPIGQDRLMEAIDRQLAALGISGHTQVQFQLRLGQRLRQLRTQQQMTLQDVAQASKITPAQLSQIELGRNGTSAWTLARIAGTLRCPLHELFKGI